MWLHFFEGPRASVLLILVLSTSVGQPDRCATAGDASSSQTEFSGIIVKKVNGKPGYYFDAPPGYKKLVGAASPLRQG